MSEQDFPGGAPTVAADAAAVLQRLFDLISATNRAADPNWQEKVFALVADDYEGIEVPVGKTYHGVEGFKEFTLRWQTAVPDNAIEIINKFATQDQICLEYIRLYSDWWYTEERSPRRERVDEIRRAEPEGTEVSGYDQSHNRRV